MGIQWKYKIDLTDDAISKISKKYNVTIPDDLINLLKEANASTPSKVKFMLGVDERILGAILSFNPGETEADSFETAMTAELEKNILPFGIDPFGNYICYNVKNGNIVFYDHEDDSIKVIADNLKEFLNMLYE